MAEKAQNVDTKPASDGTPPAVVPPKRSPGHRGADVRDTVAEMAAKAQEISQEAGSKMAAAMKDVISAAAGLTGFAIESARDLVQYMVRRGQMTQEEADKLIREAEDADSKRKPHPVPPPSKAPKPPPVVRVEPVAPPPPPPPVRPAPRVEPARATAVSATPKKATPAKSAKKKAAPRAASKGKSGAKASAKKKPARR
jgi:polyhydroxyalkanoate synthesis regulator phasin